MEQTTQKRIKVNKDDKGNVLVRIIGEINIDTFKRGIYELKQQINADKKRTA